MQNKTVVEIGKMLSLEVRTLHYTAGLTYRIIFTCTYSFPRIIIHYHNKRLRDQFKYFIPTKR